MGKGEEEGGEGRGKVKEGKRREARRERERGKLEWTRPSSGGNRRPGGYRGGSPTAVRPSDPALCGSCPLVTPY